MQPNVLIMNTTCHESYIRFPTDAKILLESAEWLLAQTIPNYAKEYKLGKPKSKFKEIKVKYQEYSNLRKILTQKEGIFAPNY
jgi:transposase, IS5 family